MKNIANIFGRVTLFTLPILFILFPTLVAELLDNTWITVISVTIGYILYVTLINVVNKWQGYYWEGHLKRILILIAATALAVIIMRTINQANGDVYKMGTIQLVITGGCMLIMCAIIIASYKEEHGGSIINLFTDPEESFSSLFSFFGIFSLSLMYSYWATWLIWFPVALVLGVIAAIAAQTIKERDLEDHLNLLLWTPLVMFGLGFVSLVWQFWNGIVYGLSSAWYWIVNALQFPVITSSYGLRIELWVFLALGILLATSMFFGRRYDKRQKKKAAEKLAADRKASDKAKKEAAQKKQDEEEKQTKEEAQRKLEKRQNELKEKVLKAEKPSWVDILDSNQSYSAEIFVKAKLKELFEISELKKQITWNGAYLKRALVIFNDISERWFDDEILQQIVDQIRGLQKELKGYDGYASFEKQLNEYEKIQALLLKTEVPVST